MNQLKLWVAPLLLLIMSSLSPFATASIAGWGVVHMGGAIIDSACAIDAGDREQAIDMGNASINQVINKGQGTVIPFSVKLINCVLERHKPNLPDWRYFRVTFDGDADQHGFRIQGQAKGFAIKIMDNVGNVARPGVAMPQSEVSTRSMLLNYSIELIGNNQPIQAGDFFSTVKFKLDYY
ncbi:fimbrial protein [Serratia sp. NPDC078593]|uniref:fimbrial protein n=1 Tax=unclassified Serratia (in: enterobacteria) TaxID=2647522 RepID=UPI0037D35BD8